MSAESVIIDVLHRLIDVAAGRQNLPAHEADALHEQVTPGHTQEPPTDDEIAAANAVLERQKVTGTTKQPMDAG